MKISIAFIIIAVIISSATAQKKEFKENAIKEISTLIENAYELLDKPASEVLAAGRPGSIQGGNKWEVVEIDTSAKNKKGGAIVIGTGCGALTLMLAPATNKVYGILYLANKNTNISQADLIEAFDDKYVFGNSGDAIVETKNLKKIGLSIAVPMILIAKSE